MISHNVTFYFQITTSFTDELHGIGSLISKIVSWLDIYVTRYISQATTTTALDLTEQKVCYRNKSYFKSLNWVWF